jgi:hypothetical protein
MIMPGWGTAIGAGLGALSAMGGSTGPDGIPTGRIKELRNLYQPAAFDAFSGIGQNLGFGSAFNQGIQQGGQNLFGTLQGAGSQLQGLLGPGFAQQQLQGLTGLLQENLGQSLGNIDRGALGQGVLGSGRSGVAAGQAIGDTQRALMAGGANLLQGDLNARRTSAANLGNINVGAGTGGINAMGQLQQAALSPFMQQFSPLQAYGSMLGMGTYPQQQGGGWFQNLNQLGNTAANLGLTMGPFGNLGGTQPAGGYEATSMGGDPWGGFQIPGMS